MKKIISVTLALALLLSLTLPALAIDATVTSSGGTGISTLTYTVAQSFTVTIPESTAINAATKTGTGTVTVAAGTLIDYGNQLTVTITAATNYDAANSKFRMKNGGNDNYIEYTIKKGSTDVVKDTAFLTVLAGTVDETSAELTYTAAAPTISGIYTDTLTFTVSVVSTT